VICSIARNNRRRGSAPGLHRASSSGLAQFTIFASVICDTPATVPYCKGETYAPLLTKLIPRFVYPDQPQELSGRPSAIVTS
jgi:hypothetical protein